MTGIDVSRPDLALVTPDRITDGHYLRAGEKDGAIVTAAYADQNGIEVGDKVDVGGEKFEVVGLASAGLGGRVVRHLRSPLRAPAAVRPRGPGKRAAGQGRELGSGRERRGGDRVELQGVGGHDGAGLADQVSGSLTDAQDLSDKLGTALAGVSLLGAILIASLLTLSSVNKRTRELGTLKAIGWRGRQVVRQIAGESLAQGILGGVAGAALGIGAAALIGSLGISLEASVAADGGGGPVFAGPGGVAEAAEAATEVILGAPVDPTVVVAAVALAALGGLIAGVAGAARAARLRPAEALRSVE